MDEHYLSIITAALCVAVLLNFISANTRGMFLSCITIILLCILSPKLDYVALRNLFGAWWYIILMSLEVVFIQIALKIKAPGASLAIATCSVYNLLCHFIAMIFYNWNRDPIDLHFALIRIGEIAQIASLIFFTEPVARLVVVGMSMLPKRRNKENTDGRNMVAAPNS